MPRDIEPTKDELTELLAELRKIPVPSDPWSQAMDKCMGAILADRLRDRYFKRDEAA